MATHRIAAIASRCRACTSPSVLLASFKPAPHLPARSAALATIARRQNFHQSALVGTSEKPESDSDLHGASAKPEDTRDQVCDEDGDFEEAEPVESVSEADPEISADNSTPWYLQVEPPKIQRSPLRSRAPLPPLPEDPPEELAPLLKELDEEQGITSMKIMDLRHLDRPAAIGANTIMIVGTARSVRHLHGTADRICRWLRSEYKWRPHADGLLGRNELKLINRRKRRRGKVVSGEMGVLDEAESAGWVCVNAGQNGIVVQLFTEAKREEIDLEGLWNDVLEKDRQRKERLAKKMEEDALVRRVPAGPPLVDKPVRHYGSFGGAFIHSRNFHTGRRLFQKEEVAAKEEPSTSEPPSGEEEQRMTRARAAYLARASSLGHCKALLRDLRRSENPGSLLGTGPHDRESTQFLRSFYMALGKLAPITQIQYNLQLLTLASFADPGIYPIQAAQEYLRQKREEGVAVKIDFWYWIILQLALIPRHYVSAGNKRLENIEMVLEDMQSDYEMEEIEAFESSPEVKYARFLSLAPEGLIKVRRHIMQRRYIYQELDEWVPPLKHENVLAIREQFGPLPEDMLTKYHPIPDASAVHFGIIEHHLDALCAFAWCNDWRGFWKLWDDLQLAMIPRTIEYYQVALGAILLGNNQVAAIRAARLFPIYMNDEETVVGLGGDLAAYMLAILDLAKSGRRMAEFDLLEEHCREKRKKRDPAATAELD
ncbi:hypothetical protein EX30DRAFT_337209 [Ascodesmis nigricans]|uniref:ATPase synthesis protein 25 n=1 Tax=Ascodesmis nigricans TaxID=341454 RepID=A0A4S2N5Z3_9PEZI|nr:hypothetical protein EX30DRAFT_337209 [Ascodesmis nigricans]